MTHQKSSQEISEAKGQNVLGSYGKDRKSGFILFVAINKVYFFKMATYNETYRVRKLYWGQMMYLYPLWLHAWAMAWMSNLLTRIKHYLTSTSENSGSLLKCHWQVTGWGETLIQRIDNDMVETKRKRAVCYRMWAGTWHENFTKQHYFE